MRLRMWPSDDPLVRDDYPTVQTAKKMYGDASMSVGYNILAAIWPLAAFRVGKCVDVTLARA